MKLINWAEMPLRVATNEGELLAVHDGYAEVLPQWADKTQGACIKSVPLSMLRLATAEPWLL